MSICAHMYVVDQSVSLLYFIHPIRNIHHPMCNTSCVKVGDNYYDALDDKKCKNDSGIKIDLTFKDGFLFIYLFEYLCICLLYMCIVNY